MPEPIAITIGGKDYPIRRLTVRQLRDVVAAIGRAQPTGDAVADEQSSCDAMIMTLAAALSRDYQEMAAEALLGIETTLPELAAAHRAVLKLAGLLSPGQA